MAIEARSLLKWTFNAFLMPQILQRRDISLAKALNHELDHMGDPLRESPRLLERACYSYPLETLSCLQPDQQVENKISFPQKNHLRQPKSDG